MKINKDDLKRRIQAYNAGRITDHDKAQLWDDMIEICAYQIKKSRKDPAYYDFIQDMVIYILDHYIMNFTEIDPKTGKEFSSLAFMLQSAYYSKLVLWNNKYQFENNEFATLNISSADCDGNSTELINTWSNDNYQEAWMHAWGSKDRRRKVVKPEEPKEEENLEKQSPEDREQRNDQNVLSHEALYTEIQREERELEEA